MSNLFFFWMCVMLLYEMETTGSVSEMHFTALVENVIDWSESHCVWPPKLPLQFGRQMAYERKFQTKSILKKETNTKLSYSFLEKMLIYLWRIVPIKYLLSHQGKQLIWLIMLSYPLATPGIYLVNYCIYCFTLAIVNCIWFLLNAPYLLSIYREIISAYLTREMVK